MFTFEITSKATYGATEHIRTVPIELNVKNHDSPFILALNRLSAATKIAPKGATFVYRLRSTLSFLESAISSHLDLRISKYNRESFDDLLYVIDQELIKCAISDSEKIARSNCVRGLLAKVDRTLGDGTEVKTCLEDYVCMLKSSTPSRLALRSLSTIQHSDLRDLESKAKIITTNQLNGILEGCYKDLEDYLKTCEKQRNFAKYKIKQEVKESLFRFFETDSHEWGVSKNRKVDVLKAVFIFLEKQNHFSFTKRGMSNFTLPGGKAFLNLSESHPQCLYGSGSHPWFFMQYRLPNYLLTSCYIHLLSKTGWNVGSVAYLSTDNITKLKNGSYEIQLPKYKTEDDTPKFVVSKADKYLKICLSLLIWNRSQLFKMGVVDSPNGNLWHGWSAAQDKVQKNPLYPVNPSHIESFFTRHKLAKITLSQIRPLKAACSFLHHQDIEIVRIMLGHSSLDTTDSYLKNELIFHLNEARILEFQNRLESSVAYSHMPELEFLSLGFQKEKVDQLLVSKGTDSNSNIESDAVKDAIEFLKKIGVTTFENKSLVTADTVKQALLLKKYYSLRWRQLFDANPDQFRKTHLNTIIYIGVFLKLANQRKPAFVERMAKSLSSRGII